MPPTRLRTRERQRKGRDGRHSPSCNDLTSSRSHFANVGKHSRRRELHQSAHSSLSPRSCTTTLALQGSVCFDTLPSPPALCSTPPGKFGLHIAPSTTGPTARRYATNSSRVKLLRWGSSLRRKSRPRCGADLSLNPVAYSSEATHETSVSRSETRASRIDASRLSCGSCGKGTRSSRRPFSSGND